MASGHIQCNLRRLIKEKEIKENREISYRMIQGETEINPASLSAMANNKVIRYNADTLARLCWYFNCDIGALLEYIPPSQEESHTPADAGISDN